MAESEVVGGILGTAVGDSLGLPDKGLSPTRGIRIIEPPDRQRLFFAVAWSPTTQNTRARRPNR